MKNKKTGKSKGYVFFNVPDRVYLEIVKFLAYNLNLDQ